MDALGGSLPRGLAVNLVVNEDIRDIPSKRQREGGLDHMSTRRGNGVSLRKSTTT